MSAAYPPTVIPTPRARRTHLPSFPRRRAPLYFGVAEHPGPFVREPLKSLDSRVRGIDDLVRWR
ncbi:hypothetical protein [Lysobacter gummosus]|uniref:hypothetical protein n=1 Tax=Lysobacter gummosus TaxID=262324 RepID=UPI003639B11B